ncbi:MAG: pyrimidine-nucleoside phosphorylase [Thomasclavelia sp.]|nr:pyrimidine-nucleoside phosphorylase [Thomasclavelia sp.]
MRIVDIIELKKHGEELTDKQIHFVVDGFTKGTIPDYQMSAFLMTVYFKGLTQKETATLTNEMTHSGEVIDLSSIPGMKVDKHSTGGVGDKTSLVLGPLVASCNINVAKMSGRGLGHTGGTLDKLEAIPGMNINVSKEDFIQEVKDIHLAIIGQSEGLVPADKKMHALRDVTGSVDCIPLIASSIMSKKIACGADTILLDVKYGDGAFMQTKREAKLLAKSMISIGKHLKRDTRASISNMNQPLGNTIGNTLEVIEAINTLKGNGPKDLEELCLEEGSLMLLQSKAYTNKEQAYKVLKENIKNGKAFKKFKEMVAYQGGNTKYIDNPDLFEKAPLIIEIKATTSGYIKDVKAKELGIVSMKLGGGRQEIDDKIDYRVGLVLNKKIGDYVDKNEILVYVHAVNNINEEIENEILDAYKITEEFVSKPKIIEEIM